MFSDSIKASWVDSDELNIKVEINMGQDTFFGNSKKFHHQRKVIIQDLENDRPVDGQQFTKRANLLYKNGEISKCNVCGSIYHLT